jgi:hypothetical protein
LGNPDEYRDALAREVYRLGRARHKRYYPAPRNMPSVSEIA